MIDKISSEILARRNCETASVISICGAADLGKTHIAKRITESLTRNNLTSNHLTLDSYLMDRKVRLEKKLSGYDIEAYNLTKAIKDLRDLKDGKSIHFYPYNHLSGMASSKSYEMNTSDIIIFEGLHSMHTSFSSFLDLSIFIYTQDENLKKIRKEADLIKRNYTKEFSNQISEKEFGLYKINIEPYRNRADYLIFLESKWNYKLTISGYKNL
ncbi:MAG: hypothetical protein R8G66_22945 [Cytophagales bacterium]|nr:hypothetical protein [Cytophagales bacterium]